MTFRECVYAAIRHEETPTVPYNVMLSPVAEQRLKAHYGADDLQDALGIHLYFFAANGKPLYASPADYGPTITDEFGVVWATSDIDRGYPVRHPLARPALAGYAFPDPLAAERWEGVAAAAERHPETFRIAVVGDLWERAHFMRGIDRLLCDLIEHPDFVHELMAAICEYDLVTLEAMAPLRPDGIFLSDDYGFQDRMMMRPGMWREFVQPYLARILTAARAYDLVTMLHTCGHVVPVVPDLIELGLDILHPIQPEAMDILHLKREFGHDITFCGGISTQRLLPFGTPQEVRDEVRRTVDAMAQGGGYIAEPGITLQADVPTENLVALIEALRDYRR